jgi:hypothetical protein
MVKRALFILLFFIAKSGFSQQGEKEQYIRKGLLRAQGNIASGKMLAYNQGGIYICGDLEYYLDNVTSLRGETFYFINATNKNVPEKLLMNHSTFSGVLFHAKTKGGLDPFIGLQPGIAITQMQSQYPVGEDFTDYPSKVTASPLFSGLVGINYYAPKFFHLFLNARYIKGTHLGNTGTYNLDEIRFSFGLGFNIHTQRK